MTRLAVQVTSDIGHHFGGGFAYLTKGGFWRVWMDGVSINADLCCPEARRHTEDEEPPDEDGCANDCADVNGVNYAAGYAYACGYHD